MESTSKINKIDFKRNPYRGVFTVVAKKLSEKREKTTDRIVVFRQYNSGEPTVTQLVDAEIERREALYIKSKNRKPVYES